MRRSALRLGVLIAIVVVAAQALLIPLFAAPAAKLAARDLPIAVAGPPQLVAGLNVAHPGAFDITTVADPAAADAAIRDRDVYGAVVVTAAGPEVHVASAASPTVAMLLTQAAAALNVAPTGGGAPAGAATGPAAGTTPDAATGPAAGTTPDAATGPAAGTTPGAATGPAAGATPGAAAGLAANATPGAATAPAAGAVVPVRDVVPVDSDDARGAGFGAAFLPLAITSLLAGVLVFLLVRRRGARAIALVTFGVLAGLAGAAVQQAWLGILPGDYLAVASVLGLFALAMAGTTAGLGALLGRGGLALGAVVLFLVGNALPGIAAAPELLPQPWGAVGQWLPIGAGGTLLRSVAYFDGNGALFAGTVLSAYAIGGLVLVVLGRHGVSRTRPELAKAPESPSELVTAS
ncbi:hypothetical protein [Actinoplanes sp. TBRC 11911]|uniref:hypothetical protein n=1 Tax=Actinoplanes sp. TBRC 11911 TaxID=2729386 RepID=UPI001B7D5D24|nr:hypothetical protein [Actinoplanes sp. TBRC 11911]